MAEIIWDEIEKLAVHNVSALVENCEYSFNKQVSGIADDIYRQHEVSLVLLAGPSASGKTTSANIIASRLEARGAKVYRLSTDDYYIDRDDVPVLESGLKDYDSLRSINAHLLQQHITDIINHIPFQAPTFDFKEGKPQKGEFIELVPADIVIIEGIHALNPYLLSWCGDIKNRVKKVSIAPRRSFRMEDGRLLQPDELRLLRRLIRDYYTRGYTFENTLRQWAEVRRAEAKYVIPFMSDVDYKIDSVFDYELIVYKQCIYNHIKDTHITELQGIKKALAQVNSMKIDEIPGLSLLNEFVHYGELS